MVGTCVVRSLCSLFFMWTKCSSPCGFGGGPVGLGNLYLLNVAFNLVKEQVETQLSSS